MGKRSKALYGIALAVLMAACTKVDNNLGQDYIPDDQKMEIKMATIDVDNGILTYLAQTDTIRSSRTGIIVLGSRHSNVLGYSSSGAVIQMVPNDYTTKKSFGNKPTADSIFLNLNMIEYAGNYDQEQNFTIYEVVKDIKRDSNYYASYPAESVCDMDNPLFKFKHSGNLTSFNKKLEVLPAGEDYLARLLEADLYYTGKTTYIKDSSFVHDFKGLYIVPESNVDGAMYKAGISYSTYQTISYMTLYFHNHNIDPTQKSDTTHMTYVISDDTGGYPGTINAIRHDYPASLRVNDTLPTSQPSAVTYIEGMVGTFTYLRLQQELVDKITALRPAGLNLTVHNAVISFEVDDNKNPAILNKAIDRLGMYYNYNRASYPIPDYNISYEYTYGEGSIPYGGYLNRSGGFYSMDITTLIQRLIKNPASARRTISLTPDETRIYSFLQTQLRGSADPGYNIKVKITYSLIP